MAGGPVQRGAHVVFLGVEGVETDICDGLARSASEGDWLTFERYVVAASRHPDRSMVPVLCEVLSRQSDDVNNEDIVEVLGLIADSDALGCLEDAMRWQPSWMSTLAWR